MYRSGSCSGTCVQRECVTCTGELDMCVGVGQVYRGSGHIYTNMSLTNTHIPHQHTLYMSAGPALTYVPATKPLPHHTAH